MFRSRSSWNTGRIVTGDGVISWTLTFDPDEVRNLHEEDYFHPAATFLRSTPSSRRHGDILKTHTSAAPPPPPPFVPLHYFFSSPSSPYLSPPPPPPGGEEVW